MKSEKLIRPFGTWSSPILPEQLAWSLRFKDLAWGDDGDTLIWLESRHDRSVIVRQPPAEGSCDLTEGVLPSGGLMYGGGEFNVRGDKLIFAARDGRLYQRDLLRGGAKPIIPEYGKTASPVISPDCQWVIYIHTDEHQDCLALTRMDGSMWPIKLCSGSDFYMQPVWHPSGQRIAWVEWDHPNMPWDGARLQLAELGGTPPQIISSETIAGNASIPVFQPEFSPDGQWLSYIITDNDWDSLVVYHLETHHREKLVSNCSLGLPAWVQGMRVYDWSPDSRAIYFLRNGTGFASLWRVELESGLTVKVGLEPYTWLSQPAVSQKTGEIACIASAPGIPPRIVIWNGHQNRVIRRSTGENFPPEFYAFPNELNWRSDSGETIHGLYYPPTHLDYTGEGKPPAIIHLHGGPNSQSTAAFSTDAAFFTSRGYAYLTVNYRGSSGYGRAYQQSLNGAWGKKDVEDAASAAAMLAERGLANPRKLVIKGSSAGGYTALNTLIRYPGVYQAGICAYPVANLFAQLSTGFKFEQYYNDALIGRLPEAAEKYHAWSPIFHAESIRDAVALFHGSDDPVVPERESEELADILRRNKVPLIYKVFPGEGHGWKKNETEVEVYRLVEQFLLEQVIFSR